MQDEYRSFVAPFVQATIDCDGLMLWEYAVTERTRAFVGGVEQALIRCVESLAPSLGLDETLCYRTYDVLLAVARRAVEKDGE